MSVYVPVPCYFYYDGSVVQLEIRMDDDTSYRFLISQDCLGYLGFLYFPYEAQVFPFKVCEELCCSPDGNCIESVFAFGRITGFIVLTRPIFFIAY